MQQVKTLNLLNVSLNECSTVKNVLLLKIKHDSTLIEKQRDYSSLLSKQIDQQLIIIKNNNTIAAELKANLDKAQKLYRREKIKTAIFGGFSGVLAAVLITFLIVK